MYIDIQMNITALNPETYNYAVFQMVVRHNGWGLMRSIEVELTNQPVIYSY